MNNIDNLINSASSQAQQEQASQQTQSHGYQTQDANMGQQTQSHGYQTQDANMGQQTHNPNMGQQTQDPNMGQQTHNPNMGQQTQASNQEFIPHNQNPSMQHDQMGGMPQAQSPNMQHDQMGGMQQQNTMMQQQNPNMMQQQNPNMMQQQNPNMMQQQNPNMMPQAQNPMMQQQNTMMQQQNPNMMQQQNPNMMQQAGQLPQHLQQYAMPTDMSMESLDAMGMQVDHWLKPDYVGMMIGDTPSPVQEIIVDIEMIKGSGYTQGYGLRYGKEPVVYDFTIDGVTSVKTGQPWFNSIMQATSTDSQARPYSAAQLVFEVAKDIVAQDGTVLASVGESLGYTTPQSNWHDFSKFYKLCNREGLLGQTVRVKITNMARTKDQYKWGILKFELLETTENSETSAA
ncbi:kinase [Pseudoalteromonas phage KB12-38]|nr:kinase [Pseudoalteromonas phage KB12-38]